MLDPHPLLRYIVNCCTTRSRATSVFSFALLEIITNPFYKKKTSSISLNTIPHGLDNVRGFCVQVMFWEVFPEFDSSPQGFDPWGGKHTNTV